MDASKNIVETSKHLIDTSIKKHKERKEDSKTLHINQVSLQED